MSFNKLPTTIRKKKERSKLETKKKLSEFVKNAVKLALYLLIAIAAIVIRLFSK